MSVKIKSIGKKPTELRKCSICEKMKDMERFQRFCSPLCRQAASDMDKYGLEFKVALHSGKR